MPFHFFSLSFSMFDALYVETKLKSPKSARIGALSPTEKHFS